MINIMNTSERQVEPDLIVNSSILIKGLRTMLAGIAKKHENIRIQVAPTKICFDGSRSTTHWETAFNCDYESDRYLVLAPEDARTLLKAMRKDEQVFAFIGKNPVIWFINDYNKKPVATAFSA